LHSTYQEFLHTYYQNPRQWLRHDDTKIDIPLVFVPVFQTHLHLLDVSSLLGQYGVCSRHVHLNNHVTHTLLNGVDTYIYACTRTRAHMYVYIFMSKSFCKKSYLFTSYVIYTFILYSAHLHYLNICLSLCINCSNWKWSTSKQDFMLLFNVWVSSSYYLWNATLPRIDYESMPSVLGYHMVSDLQSIHEVRRFEIRQCINIKVSVEVWKCFHFRLSANFKN